MPEPVRSFHPSAQRQPHIHVRRGANCDHCTACGKDRYDVERHDLDIGSGIVGGGGG